MSDMEGDSDAVNDLSNETELTLEGIYSLDGRRLAAPERGINLMKYRTSDGNVIVKKVVR